MMRKAGQALKYLISGTIGLILGNAALKRRLLAGLGKFPRLEGQLRRVLAALRRTPEPGGITNLSPQARRIHEELIAAIWRHNNKEQG